MKLREQDGVSDGRWKRLWIMESHYVMRELLNKRCGVRRSGNEQREFGG